MKHLLYLTFTVLSIFNMNAQNPEQPIITGEFTDSVTHSAWFNDWQNLQGETFIAEVSLKELRSKNLKDISVVVFLGTWCEDSQVHIPALLDCFKGTEVPIKIIGVNREKECPFKPKECKNWDIEFVPTIKILKSNVEIGRIVESPSKSLEEDLIEIIDKN